MRAVLFFALVLSGCGGPSGGWAPLVVASDGQNDQEDSESGADAGEMPEDALPEPADAGEAVEEPLLETSDAGEAGEEEIDTPCPDGVICPDEFPFVHHGNSDFAPFEELDAYACAPQLNESGGEFVYRIQVQGAAFLSAAVYDEAQVDLDVHILSDWEAAACLDRGDHHAKAHVTTGTYFVVVDTYANDQQNFAGEFKVEIGLITPSVGPCNMETGEMPRVGDGGDTLEMPATGAMVMEAHLVTQEEEAPYPSSSRERIEEHYEMSQALSGFVMHRNQSWAPLEGGDFYGCGIGSPTLFPVLDEHWYVNMYWISNARPSRGTRMLLKKADEPYAVVVAAGYETGPGNLAHIGGTTEETHFYLDTQHLSTLTLGLSSDTTLPLGPRICDDEETETNEMPSEGVATQIKYPTHNLFLPFTEKLVTRWREIAGSFSSHPEPIFMKVGASSFASSRTLHCLADDDVLAFLSEEEIEARNHFNSGDAAGSSPFERTSLAVRSGKTAAWAIDGVPSPLEEEIQAIGPATALIEYGTNDMQMGLTYESAMWNFYESLTDLTAQLIQEQILPVLHTNRSRTDSAAAGQWVETYNQIIRGVAQQQQIPFIDQFNALAPLSDGGLSGDGVHASTYYENGAARTCDFSEAGMQYGYNRRNEVTLQWLSEYYHRWSMESDFDVPLSEIPDLGNYETPIEIHTLPFLHAGDTSSSLVSQIDFYTGCNSEADESGPEIVYELTLEEETSLRMMVFDREGVDVDIHLLDHTVSASSCMARAHRLIEGTLPAGTYGIVVDSFVANGDIFDGAYLLSILSCDPADEACGDLL